MSNKDNIAELSRAYEYMSDAILLVDKDACICYQNPAYIKAFAYPKRDLSGQKISSILSAKHNSNFYKNIAAILSQKGKWSGQCWIKNGQDESVACQVQVDTVYNQEHLVSGYILCLRNETKLEHNDIVLQEMAYHDELTGVANRALFNQLLKHEISQCERQNRRFALLFIDLDRFKQVNDSLGHDVGDHVLCSVADRLEKCLRKSDVVARMGGDEFVAIISDIQDPDTIANVAEKLVREIHKPYPLAGNVIEIGCSIGISVYPDNGNSAKILLQHADVAMYRAKQQGGSNYFYFSEALNKELLDNKTIEKQIIAGLSDAQFVPYFQPLIDQQSKAIVGIECLARWQHPSRGLIGPIEFIHVAKKSGLIHQILIQMLEGAFKHIRQWNSLVGDSLPISMNITSQQFYQQKTFDVMAELLNKYGLSTEDVRIEVTESTLQEKGEALIEQLARINHAGFSLTMDDFGTGYSSLKYLQQLPVDSLKIDRSFVRNLDNNPHDKIIVKAIIQLAKALDIKVIAEGVETDKQQKFLLENGCHIMQGFLFSPALPADKFSEFVSLYKRQITNKNLNFTSKA
jgi:diguanylate cyclase (GGDEF)-like protein/PAS domain S-box-containing protein